MSLLGIILILVIVGLVLYLVNTFIPMDPKIRTILNVVVVIFVILWILGATGLLGSLSSIRVH